MNLTNKTQITMKRTLFFTLLLGCCITYGQIVNPHIIKVDVDRLSLDESIALHLDSLSIPDSIYHNSDTIDLGGRRLFFIHGLSGNASSLSRLADACENNTSHIPGFPTRRVHTTCLDYSSATQSSLNQAALVVLSQMRQVNALDYSGVLGYRLNPNRAIAFGHSQGAMVGRAIYHLECDANYVSPTYGHDFGGFVSLGGPLQGAIIINNIGHILEMLNDACTSLSAGPLSQPIVDNVLTQFFGNNYRQQMCYAVSHTVLPLIMDSYTDNITQDYAFWSERIWDYNSDIWCNHYASAPKIAFYGVEPRENILWRTTNWIVNEPNDCDYFQANDDFSFLNNTIIPLQQHYNSRYLYFKQKREQELAAASVLWFFDPFMAIALTADANTSKKRMEAWKQGVDWFSRANHQWEACIGALVPNYSSTILYTCSCSATYPYYYPTTEVCQHFCGYATSVPVTTISVNHKLNDGVVLAESACNLPAMTHFPIMLYYSPSNGENQNSRGTSHMQMRNDGSIGTAFNSLFNGDYGCFFRTSTW